MNEILMAKIISGILAILLLIVLYTEVIKPLLNYKKKGLVPWRHGSVVYFISPELREKVKQVNESDYVKIRDLVKNKSYMELSQVLPEYSAMDEETFLFLCSIRE